MNFVLEVKKLNVYLKRINNRPLKIINDIDMKFEEGAITGITGETHSGKTVLAKSLVNILTNFTSTVEEYKINDISYTSYKDMNWKAIKGNQITYFKDMDGNSLNPSYKIYNHFFDVVGYRHYEKNIDMYTKKEKSFTNELKKYKDSLKDSNISKSESNKTILSFKKKIKSCTKKSVTKKQVASILSAFEIEKPSEILSKYPNEISLITRQKIVLAMAVMGGSKIIIADDPTFKMDGIQESAILKLLKDIVAKFKLTLIFISTDMALMARMCDYVYVMYAGKILEKADKKTIFTNPKHPYTWSLISSITEIKSKEKSIYTIQGNPIDYENIPAGDPFASQNPFAVEMDFKQAAPLFKVSDNHYAATWTLHPSFPNIEIPNEVVEKLKVFKKGGSSVKK